MELTKIEKALIVSIILKTIPQCGVEATRKALSNIVLKLLG